MKSHLLRKIDEVIEENAEPAGGSLLEVKKSREMIKTSTVGTDNATAEDKKGDESENEMEAKPDNVNKYAEVVEGNTNRTEEEGGSA